MLHVRGPEGITNVGGNIELRYLIWLQVTVSSDQAKKEKSQDDTSGRPIFQKKSCALGTHFEDRSKFFREQAVKTKNRDHHALNSISVQGRRVLWCCFGLLKALLEHLWCFGGALGEVRGSYWGAFGVVGKHPKDKIRARRHHQTRRILPHQVFLINSQTDLS